jgi:aldehyde:ferredoxin oxidoreductase
MLIVDLNKAKMSTQDIKVSDIKQYIGGMGLNCKIAADNLKSGLDPFLDENLIILGAGPLVGTIMPGASRSVGLTKFPATGAIANSCGSMNFGFNLKQAGFDNVIIKGRAEIPSYLLIWDGHADLLNAQRLWGKDIVEVTDYMKKVYNSCGIIAIGQAGENRVNISLALIDKTSTFGRGGLAAVMGSKNLKAIVAKGTLGVSIAHPKEFMKLYDDLIKRIRAYPQRESWIELGMLRSLPISLILHAKGKKDKARQINEKNYLKLMKKRRIACPSCPMADKDILELKVGGNKGLILYTSSVINPLLMFTSDCISTYDQAIKLFDTTSRYGLDSLTITAMYDFLDKMVSDGILNEDDLGFKWEKNYATISHLIEIIAKRSGIGDILSQGWNKLTELKKEFGDQRLIVKGLDVVFEPRLMKLGTMEFEQVVNPKGAHVASGGSPTYIGAGGDIEKMKRHFSRMGIPKDAQKRILTPTHSNLNVNVARLTRYSEDWYTILSSLGLCARAQMNRFYNLQNIYKFYRAVTGLSLTEKDILSAAERSWNLLKVLNVKEGFGRKDDKFPNKWFEPLDFGENKLELYDFYGKVKIDKKLASKLIDDYYDERGWDLKTGIPLATKLKELGLFEYI